MRKFLNTSAIVRTTLCLPSSVPPYGLASVNSYCRRDNNQTILIWFAAECCQSNLSHARRWDPCPLNGRWLHLEGLIIPVSHRREDPNDGHLEDALHAPPHLRWRRGSLQPPEMQQGCLDRNTCSQIPEGGLLCVTWNTRGLLGSPSSSHILQRKETQLLHSAFQEQRHHLSSRNPWEG